MNILTPNKIISNNIARAIIAAWALLGLIWWGVFPPAVVPGPLDVGSSLVQLWRVEGLPQELLSSMSLNLEALVISTAISLLLAYASVLPVARPLVDFITKLRFLGLTGLTFVFGLYLQGHQLKIGLLTLGMSVFLTTSMVAVIEAIPKEQFDHARTLGMSEWRVVWEVVILGTIDEAFDMLRQNAAMIWMMLTMVEGLVRSDGGIGALMLNENKHFQLSSVFALQLIILTIGLCQDYLLGWMRRIICPYADLKLERR